MEQLIAYLRSLYFPRNSFDSHSGSDSQDTIVWKMLWTIACLEELAVYGPFTIAGLSSWLLLVHSSLKNLELRMDNITDYQACVDSPSKLDCISAAKNLECLKLTGVLMANPPKWGIFKNLQSLEIVGARLEDPALSAALRARPNLTNLVLLGCEGVRSISIELPYLEQCKLDFYGLGNCSLSLTCPKIELLKVQGCSWIRVRDTETTCLRKLSIANNAGNYSAYNSTMLSCFVLDFFRQMKKENNN